MPTETDVRNAVFFRLASLPPPRGWDWGKCTVTTARLTDSIHILAPDGSAWALIAIRLPNDSQDATALRGMAGFLDDPANEG
jgi:hypothetical protein